MDKFEIKALEEECEFFTSRSSGPGGQNVNKTETKVELRFNIAKSGILSNRQKNKICKELDAKLLENKTILSITCQESRSQLKNKKIALKKLSDLLLLSLEEKTERIPTKPTLRSKIDRITTKKSLGSLKLNRGNLKNKIDEEG